MSLCSVLALCICASKLTNTAGYLEIRLILKAVDMKFEIIFDDHTTYGYMPTMWLMQSRKRRNAEWFKSHLTGR
jgi:hypothetical protein